MKVIIPGHLYELESMEGTNPQKIQFIEKAVIDRHPTDASLDGKFITINDGTTNEEVLKMLIDRCNYLYKKLPSIETARATYKLEEALMWLEKRTATRLAQGVENTPLPHKE